MLAKADITITEVGGTAGEYENILFLEAIRMMKALVPGGREAGGAVERKIDAMLRRAA